MRAGGKHPVEILLFGNSKMPGIDFTLDPTEGLKIRFKECYCLNYAGISGTLSWMDFFCRVTPLLDPHIEIWNFMETSRPSASKAPVKVWLSKCTDKLLKCTGSPSESKFLQQYFESVQKASDSFVDQLPALIPQAWVNWLHYRPDDPGRVRAMRKQPMRVDFI